MQSAIGEALTLLDLDDTPAMRAHFDVLVRAQHIYQEREKVRQGLWRRRGWRGIVLHIDSKTLRLMSIFWEQEGPKSDQLLAEGVDDALDNVNYNCFLVRLVESGNERGRET